jgi:hypothetical protein
VAILLLFLNLCALFYGISRWLFLRDTGRKLRTWTGSSAPPTAVHEDLKPYLNEGEETAMWDQTATLDASDHRTAEPGSGAARTTPRARAAIRETCSPKDSTCRAGRERERVLLGDETYKLKRLGGADTGHGRGVPRRAVDDLRDDRGVSRRALEGRPRSLRASGLIHRRADERTRARRS